MKIKALLFVLVMGLCVGTAYAQLGSGIVYDPTNYQNAVLRYQQLQQHLLQLQKSYAKITSQPNCSRTARSTSPEWMILNWAACNPSTRPSNLPTGPTSTPWPRLARFVATLRASKPRSGIWNRIHSLAVPI